MDDSKPEPRKRNASAGNGPKPVHVVRQGAIAASIWLKQSPTGYYYYDYSLSRSWKSASTGKTGYSTCFFERHREDLMLVVNSATEWIEEKQANASVTTIDTTRDAA